MKENRDGSNEGGKEGMKQSQVYTYKNFLSTSECADINRAIKRAERVTSGEIKPVVVQSSKEYESVEARAGMEFFVEGLSNLKGSTGFLIMISLDEKRIVIRAGEEINKKILQEKLEAIVEIIGRSITARQPVRGICSAINIAGDLLAEHFPVGKDDKNEVSDEIIFKP